MTRHHGRYGKVYINGTPVISVESWKLSLKRDKVDVTCFGDANKVKVQGLPDFTGTWAGFWDDSDTVPWTAQASTTYCNLILYADYTNNIGDYVYGPAWLDLDIETGVSKAVALSGTFEAAGAWGNTFS